MIGRTAALLAEMPAETTPGGWRLAPRPGRDLRRARALLSHDLDTLEQVADGYQGPLKIQVAGPWTLAASLELPASLEKVLTDHGAVADLTASLAEGVAAHAADVRRRVPGARLLLQCDEPLLPAALAGAIPSASGLNRLRPVKAGPAADALRVTLAAAQAFGVVHCCAAHPPFGIMTQAGARGVYVNLSQLRRDDEDALAEAADSGTALFAGTVQPLISERAIAGDLATTATELWRRLGLPAAWGAGQVVIGPACGLAGVSPQRAAELLAACREAGRILPEMIEEGSR